MAQYQVGSVCYPSALDAAQATAALHNGVTTNGSNSLHFSVQALNATTLRYVAYYTGSTQSITRDVPFTPAPCALPSMSVGDGVALGWLVVIPWAVVFGIKFIARRAVGASS